MENNFIKITNVAYRILDFFPDGDPLKNKLKEKVLAVLENLTLVFGSEGWVSLQKEKATMQVLDDIEILENYFSIGMHQGWVDSINFLIITKEYKKIKSQLIPPEGIIRKTIEITASHIKENFPLSISDKKEKNNPQFSILDKFSEGKNQLNYKNSDRQGTILKILNNKGKAQVSDLLKELPKVTKRTIRRDLDDLLKRGQIVRLGKFNQVSYQLSGRTR